MLNSAITVKVGLVALGLFAGTIGTGVGAWLTLGREVVTKAELKQEIEEAIQSELSAIIARVEPINTINRNVNQMNADIAALKAQVEMIRPQLDRVENKIDRHMQISGDNGH